MPMPISFAPPSIKSLGEIDTADDSYGGEPVVLQGVVSGKSQGGWGGENDDYEVHCFSFVAWRQDDGAIVNHELTVLRAVPPEFDYWDDFPKHSIQKIRALLSSDRTRAIFKEALPPQGQDKELEAISTGLQNPVSIETKRHGTLKLDRSINRFVGKTKWSKKSVDISLDASNEKLAEKAIATAEILWSSQAKWKNEIEALAATELLDLKNDSWLQEGETALTKKKFITAMSLTSISIDSDGSFTFFFNDGDLFWGHMIIVSGDPGKGPTEAKIGG